ncbi:hypothetical protein ACFL7E_05890 [Thermodesulfobacteriota bacterium]
MSGDPQAPYRPSLFWWIRQILLILLGCFFLIFGILILVSSYRLQEPYQFIMTFFAANFIILFSATLVFIFAYRMKPYLIKPSDSSEKQVRLDVD